MEEKKERRTMLGFLVAYIGLLYGYLQVYPPLCRHGEFNNLNRFLAIETNQVQYESSTKLFLLSNDPKFYDS